MPARFEISTRSNGELQFNLRAANDQIVLTSERYTAKASCLDGVESVRRHTAGEANFVRLEASDGRPYFTLAAANHQVIGQSQMYADAGGRDDGIRSVITNAAVATVVDLTA